MGCTRNRYVGALVSLVLVGSSCSSGTSGTATPSSSATASTQPPAPAPTTSSDTTDGTAPDPTAAATTTTTFSPRSFSIAASGDILLHASVIESGLRNAGGTGYDFDPMFERVRAEISAADLALCHMETPISADDTDLTQPGTLSFNAPREIATAIRNAGFDGCDTASNHTWDRGLAGLEQTSAVLGAAGLRHAGGSRNPLEAAAPPIYDVNGVQVGHLAFTYTIYNNGSPDPRVPPEAPWLAAISWPRLGAAGIIDQARALRARGAQFIVVSMHWGQQYVHQPTEQQRELARQLLADPAVDLILGDHVHVVQPCEKLGDKYVTYGMGNFLSNQSPDTADSLSVDNQDGTLQRFDVAEVAPGQFRVVKMTYTPTWVEIPGHRIQVATPDGPHADSWARTVVNMGLLGPGACDAAPAS